MTAEQTLALAMKRRTETGLRLEWFIPQDGRNFVAYPENEARKQAWIESGKRQGWELI